MSGPNRVRVNRRTFVKDAALAAAAGCGLTGGLGALSGLVAQPGPSRPGARLVMAAAESRPFTMICLGDSVMWGQGLEEPTKFTWLVKTWLEGRLGGRPVNRLVYARSGATIAPDSEIPDESRVEPWMNNRNLGEVPCSWPWVRRQVVAARDDLISQQISPDAVDLVLVDGGINDIGVIRTLLNPTKDLPEIRSQSAEFCGVQMSDLLDRVRATFPKAKILVTGYFPIVSEETDLAALGVLLAILVPIAGVAATAPIRSKLASISSTWYQASNADLAGAVASFNSRWAAAASVSSGTAPAAFARIPWGVTQSYAAPASRLWLAGLPNDPVYWQRVSACASAGAGKAGSPICLDAKIGHPNIAGAAAYADACRSALQQYIPEWTGAKPMSACVEMDPMPVAGRPTTITVVARADGPAGPTTVPATVQVGGQKFATGTAVPVTLCTSVKPVVDREAPRSEAETTVTLSCAPITVTAQGYLDVVIRDYLKAEPLPLP